MFYRNYIVLNQQYIGSKGTYFLESWEKDVFRNIHDASTDFDNNYFYKRTQFCH